MQGWDSVEIRADVELGGTDQLFNMLVGRDLQKEEGQPQQVVMALPLLEGLDGVKKMSKSYGNYVGVNDAPNDMFGKIMSVSDTLMVRYYQLLLGETLAADIHPMEAKKSLAEKITARYHGVEAGKEARATWDARFSQRDVGAGATELAIAELPADLNVLSLTAHSFKAAFAVEKSNGELRKQYITTGSVQLNGEKLTDPNAAVAIKEGDVLKLSKKHAVRFV
jgi:tyrosyl-tRNA synthetase